MPESSGKVELFCPFVGLGDDSQTRLAYPSAWNVCYRVLPPASPRLEHQSAYCLTSGYLACPVLRGKRDAPLPDAIRAPRVESGQGRWRTSWSVVAAVGLLLLGLVSGWMARSYLWPLLSSGEAIGAGLPTVSPSPEMVSGAWTPTSSPSPTASPTLSPVALTSTATPLPTLTPTATPLVCFQLISPQDEAELPNKGAVAFTWGEQAGADKYILTYTLPNGLPVTFEFQKTEHTRYMESLIMGGRYTWRVTALDPLGEKICTAKPYTFTKPVGDTPTPTGEPVVPTDTPMP
ncbi:MAG: hypothetical protein KJ606_11905 [Chloroflexi bacterium]|nr:hypothetical protein [Chloroflexota bacterium]